MSRRVQSLGYGKPGGVFRKLPIGIPLVLLLGSLSLPLEAGDTLAVLGDNELVIQEVSESLTEEGYSVLRAAQVDAHMQQAGATLERMLSNESLLKAIAAALHRENDAVGLVLALAEVKQRSVNPDLGTVVYSARVTLKSLDAASGSMLCRVIGKGRGVASEPERAAERALEDGVKDAVKQFLPRFAEALKDTALRARRLRVDFANVDGTSPPELIETALEVIGNTQATHIRAGCCDQLAENFFILMRYPGSADDLRKVLLENDTFRQNFEIRQFTEDRLQVEATIGNFFMVLVGPDPAEVRGLGRELFRLVDGTVLQGASWEFDERSAEFRLSGLTGLSAGKVFDKLESLAAGVLPEGTGALRQLSTREDQVFCSVGGEMYRVEVDGVTPLSYSTVADAVRARLSEDDRVRQLRLSYDAAEEKLGFNMIVEEGFDGVEETLRGDQPGLGELELQFKQPGLVTFAFSVRELALTLRGSDPEPLADRAKEIAEFLEAAPEVRDCRWETGPQGDFVTFKLLFAGEPTELYRLIELLTEAEGWQELHFLSVTGSELCYRLGELWTTLAVILEGIAAERYEEVSGIVDELLSGHSALRELRKNYDEQLGQLRYVFRTTHSAPVFESWLVPLMKDRFDPRRLLVLGLQQDGGLHFAWRDPSRELALRLQGLAPAVHERIGETLRERLDEIEGLELLEVQYTPDRELWETKAKWDGALEALVTRLGQVWGALPEPVVPQLVSLACDGLSYSLPAPPQRVVQLVIEGLPPERQQEFGSTLVQAIQAFSVGEDRVELTELQYDAQSKQLTVTLQARGNSAQLDSQLWCTIAQSSELPGSLLPVAVGEGKLRYQYAPGGEPFHYTLQVRIRGVHDQGRRTMVEQAFGQASQGLEALALDEGYDGATSPGELWFVFGTEEPVEESIAQVRRLVDTTPELSMLRWEGRVANVLRFLYTGAREGGGASQADVVFTGFDEEEEAELIREAREALESVASSVRQLGVRSPETLWWRVESDQQAHVLAGSLQKRFGRFVAMRIGDGLVEFQRLAASTTGEQPTDAETDGEDGEQEDDAETRREKCRCEYGTLFRERGVVVQSPPQVQQLQETDLPGLVEQVADAVVVVLIHREGVGLIGHGSGFFVSPTGLILTNAHVATPTDEETGRPLEVQLQVRTRSGATYRAAVLASDQQKDLALVKVAGSDFKAVQLGSAAALRVGDPLFVMGAPLDPGLDQSVMTGIVSSLSRGGLIQTSAVIHGGNSGGPAFDYDGKVIGVVVSTAYGEVMGNEAPSVRVRAAGVSFLVAIDQARELLQAHGR